MAKGIEYKIVKVLKGHEMLLEEISEKLSMPQGKVSSYLGRMERAGKIKSGITEDVPFEKVYTA